VFPAASVATQVTAVSPTTKREPDAGKQTTPADPQLSDTDGENMTNASQPSGAAFVTTLFGHAIAGASRSYTTTRNAHVDWFPPVSRAEQFTTFVPLGKTPPEGGTHETGTLPQLSVAVGLKVATASQRPGAVFNVMSVGQEITGFSASVTLTGNMHNSTLPDASSARQNTTVSPTGNRDPDCGSQST